MSSFIEIKDCLPEELSWFTQRSETALLRANEPEPGYFIAESAKVILRALDAGYEPVCFLLDRSMIQTEGAVLIRRCPAIPCYTADETLLRQITGWAMARGAAALMRRQRPKDWRELAAGKQRIAVLENVVNPTNIGAVIRSAAALGVEAVFLTYDCSDPLQRRAARVSMGCVFQVPWTYLPREHWTDELKQEGFTLTAMALTDKSIPLDSPELAGIERMAVLIGNEGNGLKQQTIDASDLTVRIPMAGGVDSLNAAAASAVAFWQLCRI